MTVDFKENAKLTKELLILNGRFLSETLEEVEKINDRLSSYNTQKENIFDETLYLGTQKIKEALELVHIKLGQIELDGGKTKK